MRKILLLPVLLVLTLLLAGCTQQSPGPSGPGTQNATLIAQYGDNVTVDYTLRVDGKVLDTSMMDVARTAGIYDGNASYQPLTFKLLLGQGLIPGFINGILGMKAGESKNFSVAPADGYGLVNPSMITNMSRYYNMSRYEEVPMEYFISSNITVEKDIILPSAVGYVSIYNFTNDTVTLEYILAPGQKFAPFGLPQEVVNVTNDTMVIRFDMEANHTYIVTNADTGAQKAVRATYADNDTIVMDGNSPLAGKELDFEVTLRALTR